MPELLLRPFELEELPISKPKDVKSLKGARGILAGTALIATLTGTPLGKASTAFADGSASPSCQFILGFQTLRNLDPQDTGYCVDNQTFAANGDAQQHTTKGLMAWRKADNWTAFTNGYQTWINGPQGLQERLNTQRFSWEEDAATNGFVIIVGAAEVSREAVLNPEQAINDINIKYSDPNRQTFIRQLFRNGLSVFDQTRSASDSDPQFDNYYKGLTGKSPGDVWSQEGTLNQAIAGVDSVGPLDASDSGFHGPCTTACAQPEHDRPNKFGSIGTTEAFYQGIPKASSAFTYAFQLFAMIKEAKDNAYRRFTPIQGAENLSDYDIYTQVNKYVNENKTILGLSMIEMQSFRDQFRTFALDPNCC